MKVKLPEIAILLACHNRREKTIRCIKSLVEQQGISETYTVEIFLVDDASTDGTADQVAQQFPEVNIIKGDGNLFWSRGMRLAWKTSAEKKEFDFYLWVNDDVIVFPNAILIMLESNLKAGMNAIICGTTQSEITQEYTYGGQTRKGKVVIPNDSLQECVIMNGNFVLISDQVYKKVGMIDSFYHHAIGDHDYGLQAIKKGVKIFIPPGYIGTCEEHESWPTWQLSEIPFKKRLRSLYSPLGNSHPYYFFTYERRHFGLLVAVKHFLSIHLRLVWPGLWKQKSSVG